MDWSNSIDYVFANWIYFLTGMRPASEAAAALPAAQARFEALMGALDSHMQGREWLVGGHLTLAVRSYPFCRVDM